MGVELLSASCGRRERLLHRPGFPVRPVMGHGVAGVDHREDAPAVRGIPSSRNPCAGSPLPIPPLVVSADDIEHGRPGAGALQDLDARAGVLLDRPALIGIQDAWLSQYRFGGPDLADVVEQGPELERFALSGREPERVCQSHGGTGYAPKGARLAGPGVEAPEPGRRSCCDSTRQPLDHQVKHVAEHIPASSRTVARAVRSPPPRSAPLRPLRHGPR